MTGPSGAAGGHLILVLGCHRSGTSLVARSLMCLGAELGPRAEWSGPDNPTGFWEDRDALEINEALLAAARSSWSDVAPIFPDRNMVIAGGPAILGLLRVRLAVHPVFALKDPRLCRLLPVWRPAIAAVGCRVSVVHVVRHPLDVAASLQKRNGLSIEQGLALWQEHTGRARCAVDPAWPSVTVHYDRLMQVPQRSLVRIADRLGLRYSGGAADSFVAGVVDFRLRHELGMHAGDGEKLPDAVCDLWQRELALTA